MTKTKKIGVGLSAVMAVAALFACSSSSSSGGQYDSCLASVLPGGSACISCVRSNCGSELNALENGCSDALSCICPGGKYDADAGMSSTCGQKYEESSCQAAVHTDGGSQCNQCQSQCSSSSSSGGGGAHCYTAEGGTCAAGKTLTFCENGSSCYYTVGSQTFNCNSCQDLTSCAQAAGQACQ